MEGDDNEFQAMLHQKLLEQEQEYMAEIDSVEPVEFPIDSNSFTNMEDLYG